MKTDIKFREKTVWSGEYRGISWEIQRFPAILDDRELKLNWTFYLYLFIDIIPVDAESYWLSPRTDMKRISYDYYSHGVLSSIDWHGGMTWYSKEAGFDGEKRVIKVGCDFQHLWDYERGCDYDLDEVFSEVKSAIDSFRELVPSYGYWCRWDGKVHKPEEITIKEDGSYRCGCQEASKVAS